MLKSIADALNVSAETLFEQAGLINGTEKLDTEATESAIRADPRLTEAQRRALLSVYRSYVEASTEDLNPLSGPASPLPTTQNPTIPGHGLVDIRALLCETRDTALFHTYNQHRGHTHSVVITSPTVFMTCVVRLTQLCVVQKPRSAILLNPTAQIPRRPREPVGRAILDRLGIAENPLIGADPVSLVCSLGNGRPRAGQSTQAVAAAASGRLAIGLLGLRLYARQQGARWVRTSPAPPLSRNRKTSGSSTRHTRTTRCTFCLSRSTS